MELKISRAYCILFLFLLVACVNSKKRSNFPEVTKYLGGECYDIIYSENQMYLNIEKAPSITKVRLGGSPMFSREQYASICALFIGKHDIKNIDTITIRINDNDSLFKFVYDMDEVRTVERKLKVNHEFGQAIIAGDREAAKKQLSDTINTLPDSMINTYFFDRFFKYGKVSKHSPIGFAIAEHIIGWYITYEFDTRISQTFIFIHEKGDNHKIVNIKMATLPE